MSIQTKTSLLFITILLGVIFAAAQDKRPFRLDDEFSREGISDVSFSPDGQVLAFVRSRPINQLPAKEQSSLGLVPREDVWVQDAPGRPARKITDGERDNSKWWRPVWSPDGKRLSLLSTRGGNVTLWMWERDTDRVRQISRQGGDLKGAPWSYRKFEWIDNRTILFLAPRKGELSHSETDFRGGVVRRAKEAWETAWGGNGSASVIKTDEYRLPERSLYLVDVDSGKGRRIADTLEWHEFYSSFWPSPDGRFIALMSPVASPYSFRSRMLMGFPHPVELRTIEGDIVRLNRPLPQNVHTQTIKWSPDGKELVFFANGAGPINPMLLYGVTAAEAMPLDELKAPMENPAKLYRVNIEGKTIVEVPTGDIDLGYLGAPDFIWTAKGELIFHAPKMQYGKTAGPEPVTGSQWGWGGYNGTILVPQAAKEWLLLDRNGKTRPLSKHLPKMHGLFRSINGGGELIAVSDGKVVVLDVATGNVRNLTERFGLKVGSVYGLPDGGLGQGLIGVNRFPPHLSKIVIAKAGSATADSYYILDLETGDTRPLRRPEPNATLSAFSEKSENAAFSLDDLNGTYLWRADASARPEQLLETNKYWKDVKKAEERLVEYMSLDGVKRTANVILPVGYKSGRRYPVNVNVYPAPAANLTLKKPGPVENSSPPDPVNAVYTAAGFVYLKPAVPATLSGIPTVSGPSNKSEEISSCPYMTNGVLPAVNKLIEMGIADPDRVFIEGISWGGWATLCVIGQTTRFTAAIARATGPIGDESFPLELSLFADRYLEDPVGWANVTPRISFTNVPWWRDGDRMRRNNPMTYLDRVRTPVMLIHGDLDPNAPIEFSEKIFKALATMRKQAEFVRYWGESHGNNTPANIKDEYMRRIAWWDRWGDIARDGRGNMIWDGDRAKGRNGAAPLKTEDYAKFDLFQPSPARQEMATGQKSPK